MAANKQKVHTEQAPAAAGPYSQAIKAGNFVYTAGQVGLDPGTGKLVGDSIEEQARRAIENTAAILGAAGSSLNDVVKTTVFMTDLSGFARMNEIYREYFGSGSPPARSTVQVAALPAGAIFEIECVALLSGSA